MRQRWPSRLWIVRHGQSAGNVAREAAEGSGLAMIDLPVRDVDVPLSPLGERQAAALGDWFAKMPEGERPQIVLSSPYVRAQQTARAVCEAGGVTSDAKRIVVDERLREREFGVLDRLTTRGIRERHPEQAEHRALLGKFYHRPPGGESWADVILRLRSALDTISLHYADKRVLIACHQVVVLCFRYILEEMTEADVIKVSRESNVLNCGVCEYAFDRDHEDSLCTPRLVRYNHAAPLIEEDAPLTAEPEEIMGAR
jgi:broad specificity phosphatase PhoE